VPESQDLGTLNYLNSTDSKINSYIFFIKNEICIFENIPKTRIMKKYLLLTTLLFMGVTVYAQFSLTDSRGNDYPDGSVYTVNSTDRSLASWSFLVVNDAPNDIYVSAELLSTTGDAAQFEFCYGLCYFGVTVGQKVPNTGSILIAQNSDSGRGNHMYNTASNGNAIYDYVINFFQTSADGNTRLGPELSITYRYDANATLSVEQLTKNLDITVENSMVTAGVLYLETTNNVTMQINDLQGRTVSQRTIDSGLQSVDVSSLKSQMYIVTFHDEKGSSYSTKIVVR
jgi:hypothetical protein